MEGEDERERRDPGGEAGEETTLPAAALAARPSARVEEQDERGQPCDGAERPGVVEEVGREPVRARGAAAVRRLLPCGERDEREQRDEQDACPDRRRSA